MYVVVRIVSRVCFDDLRVFRVRCCLALLAVVVRWC